ncbi:MAG: cation:proton antiporter [Pseudomonadota bacterium]
MTIFDWLPTLDLRDVLYAGFGLALLLLSLQPALSKWHASNVPAALILMGVVLAWMGLPVIDPRDGGLQTAVIEHASELIVIISLAGAGIAVDTRATWRNWQPTFRLLAVAMPLTIIGVWAMGQAWLGLSLAGAALLAAALAPTDPVLARAVQVGPPGADEAPMEVALTAEAGLNDGLAFPFVYLAITLAGLGGCGAHLL